LCIKTIPCLFNEDAAAIHPPGKYRRSIAQQTQDPEIWQPAGIASVAV
jgi:hypothetical protein